MNHQIAPSALKISDIAIRQDDQGRYCLNDLHKASGNLQKHQPRYWLSNVQARELIAELEKDDSGIPLSKIQGHGKQQGTYVAKELVYAYAMWISASFSLKVIRAYDALQSSPSIQQPALVHDALEPFQARVLVSVENGKIQHSLVPYGACIVDPSDPVSVRTFINKAVPNSSDMLEAVSLAYIDKLLDCQEAVLNGKGGL